MALITRARSATVVPIRKIETFATNLLPAADFPKNEAPDRLPNWKTIRGLQWSGRLDLNQRPLAPQAVQDAAQPSSSPLRSGRSGSRSVWGGWKARSAGL